VKNKRINVYLKHKKSLRKLYLTISWNGGTGPKPHPLQVLVRCIIQLLLQLVKDIRISVTILTKSDIFLRYSFRGLSMGMRYTPPPPKKKELKNFYFIFDCLQHLTTITSSRRHSDFSYDL